MERKNYLEWTTFDRLLDNNGTLPTHKTLVCDVFDIKDNQWVMTTALSPL